MTAQLPSIVYRIGNPENDEHHFTDNSKSAADAIKNGYEVSEYILAAHKQEPVGIVHGVAQTLDGSSFVAMVECKTRLSDGTELFSHPAPVPAVPEDYFASLVIAARLCAEKAMRKFPQPNYVLNKVAEESGEVIKAVIHYTEGREEWANVEGEIIDNLAMLIRLVTEGDQVIGFVPPESCRAVAPKGV